MGVGSRIDGHLNAIEWGLVPTQLRDDFITVSGDYRQH